MRPPTATPVREFIIPAWDKQACQICKKHAEIQVGEKAHPLCRNCEFVARTMARLPGSRYDR